MDELRIEAAADALDGIHQLADAFQSEILRLHRNQDRVRGNQGIEGEQIERGRAIEHDELVAVSQGREGVAQTKFSSFSVHQFDIGADHVLVGWYQPQLFKLSRLHRLFCRGRAHQQMICRDALRVSGQAQSAGCIRLRIAVHKQGVDFGRRKRCGQIDGGRSFPDAALLVGYGNDASHLDFRESRDVRRIGRSNVRLQCRILVQPRNDMMALNNKLVADDRGHAFHRKCSTWNIGDLEITLRCSMWNIHIQMSRGRGGDGGEGKVAWGRGSDPCRPSEAQQCIQG